MKRLLASTGLLSVGLGLLGCGAAVDPRAHDDAGSRASLDAVITDAVDAVDVPPPPRDAPYDAPRDAPYDAPRDAPVGTCDPHPPSSIAPHQFVRFHFATTGDARWVATMGQYCSPFSVQQLGDDGGAVDVALGLPFQCICECPAPDVGASMLAEVDSSGRTTTLTWDARVTASCTHYIDCASEGWPGAGYQAELLPVMLPVGPGRYRATFAVYSTLPSGCNAGGGDGGASCFRSPGGSGGPPSPQFARCDSTQTVSVEFDLPADGDVDVTVDPG